MPKIALSSGDLRRTKVPRSLGTAPPGLFSLPPWRGKGREGGAKPRRTPQNPLTPDPSPIRGEGKRGVDSPFEGVERRRNVDTVGLLAVAANVCRRKARCACLLCFLCLLLFQFSAAADEAAGRYRFRKHHDPNGIGKFYMGREIAHVMGSAAATWLERPEREQEEATSKLVDTLKLESGMVVADIGAGSGVITLPMTARVGPEGKIVAVDIQQEMLDLLAKKLKLKNIENVELVLGGEKSPRLPKASLDLALMVDVYHEFAWPYEMMLEISAAMKPGGRIVLVEFRGEDRNVPIKLVHKMTEKQVQKELALPEFGLKWKETVGTLPWQHIIVFEKQPPGVD